MADTSKTELFETMPIPRAVMTLAIPTICSSLVMVIYNLADTYFVGMLNDSVQNAAVTLAAPVLLAFNAVNNLFGVGGSSMMSRALGSKDYEVVARSSAFAFFCALFFSVLFSVGYTAADSFMLGVLGAEADTWDATAAYLMWTVTCGAVPAILNVVMANLFRAEGSTLHASIGTMSGCLLNIILDPIFILPWGLNMGAAGAGCATFISNCVACLYFFVLLFVRRGKTYVCIKPSMFGFRKSIAFGVFAVGIPAAIQNLLNVAGMTILNNLTAAWGSEAVAAMGIAQKINMVPMYVAMGFGQGIMPLWGYNFASGDGKRLKNAVKFGLTSCVVFLLAMMVAMQLGAGFLISLFMENATVVAYGTRFLRGFSLAMPFMAVDFLAVAVFNACGKGSRALIFAILRKVAFEIPALFILNAIFPLYGLAYAQAAAEVLMAVITITVLTRFLRKLPDRREPAAAAA